MDFSFTEEQKLLRQTVRRFVQENLLPLEEQFRGSIDVSRDEAKPINDELREKAKAVGLWNLAVPKEFGGHGIDAVTRVVVEEEAARFIGPGGIERGIRAD